jgi:hypothetical protein
MRLIGAASIESIGALGSEVVDLNTYKLKMNKSRTRFVSELKICV